MIGVWLFHSLVCQVVCSWVSHLPWAWHDTLEVRLQPAHEFKLQRFQLHKDILQLLDQWPNRCSTGPGRAMLPSIVVHLPPQLVEVLVSSWGRQAEEVGECLPELPVNVVDQLSLCHQRATHFDNLLVRDIGHQFLQ